MKCVEVKNQPPGAESTDRACDACLPARARDHEPRVRRGTMSGGPIVKDPLGDRCSPTVTRETIEGFQAKGQLDGVSNRTVNMDVGTLRRVLKRYVSGGGSSTTSQC